MIKIIQLYKTAYLKLYLKQKYNLFINQYFLFNNIKYKIINIGYTNEPHIIALNLQNKFYEDFTTTLFPLIKL